MQGRRSKSKGARAALEQQSGGTVCNQTMARRAWASRGPPRMRECSTKFGDHMVYEHRNANLGSAAQSPDKCDQHL